MEVIFFDTEATYHRNMKIPHSVFHEFRRYAKVIPLDLINAHLDEANTSYRNMGVSDCARIESVQVGFVYWVLRRADDSKLSHAVRGLPPGQIKTLGARFVKVGQQISLTDDLIDGALF